MVSAEWSGRVDVDPLFIDPRRVRNIKPAVERETDRQRSFCASLRSDWEGKKVENRIKAED